MVSVFYDLETSSLNNTGQIINYCFSVVDDDWREIKRLSGLVRLSCLQIPDPGAVEATKLHVYDHQAAAVDSEFEAATKIHQFLNWARGLTKAQPKLIGFNSAQFDLEYLRVTFVRNGLQPYGFYEPQDFLLAVQYLYATNDKFRALVPLVEKDGKSKISLKLEHVSRSLGLLSGRQLHESSFDVELLIKLAKYCAENFDLDIRKFSPYGLRDCQSLKPPIARTAEFSRQNGSPIKNSWKLFLDVEGNSALWVDLLKFKDSRQSREEALASVRRYKMQGNLIWVVSGEKPPADILELAAEAKKLLGRVTSEQLFGKSDCYIEEFIYRISGGDMDKVRDSIASFPRLPEDLNSDIKTLAKRYWLENTGKRDTAEYCAAFERYCRFRYGGKMQIRNSTKGKALEPKDFHPTFDQLVTEAKELRKSSDTPEIFDELLKFYSESDVGKVMS